MNLLEMLCRVSRQNEGDGRARLRDMMRLRRAFLPERLSRLAVADLVQATERCLACRNKFLCDEVLASGNDEGYALFCPNSHYIERLRHGRLRLR